MRRCVEVSVTGRVQGVWFRAYAEREAQCLGVAGWIRNEADGSVSAHLEGEAQAVEALVAWCRRGPRQAEVAEVVVRDAADQRLTQFEVSD